MSTTVNPPPPTCGWPVPLTNEQIDLVHSMPKFQGAVVNPKYVPREYQAEQLEAWIEWCRKHKTVPPWLQDSDVAKLREKVLGLARS